MIGKKYQAHKANTIDIFNAYKKQRGIINDGVNVKHLERLIDSLRKGKFTLAVAGEVKSGKSTFINALLGVELLPTDVLQASSAIVEIFKSEEILLKITFADGKELTFSDNVEEAKKKLHEVCCLKDKYRNIPTTLIDEYIVASDSVLKVDSNFIKSLEAQSKEQLQGCNDVIMQYITERTKDTIPSKIEFGYPLKWDFDELCIVDTPGVNATGGVQDVAFKFFENANAILFVHPIKPIESESFKNFVETIISERSKETLFLILTHAGICPNSEVERLYAEAKRLYKNIIPEERILVVDSLLELVHCDLKNGLLLSEIRKNDCKKQVLSSCREQAEDEGRDLIEVVYEVSHFAKMYAAIDQFSMKAPSLQLQEILEKIKEGYEGLENYYIEKIDLKNNKKQNPQTFEAEITRISDALEKCRFLTKQTKENLQAQYSGRHSLWQKDIDVLKVIYPERITGSDSIESARKHILDALNAVQNKVNTFSEELTQKLKDSLEQEGKSFEKEHSISIPRVDLSALEHRAKNSAYEEKDQYETYRETGLVSWFLDLIRIRSATRERRVGTKRVFNETVFLGNFKSECSTAFYSVVNNLPSKSKEVLDIYLEFFSQEMDSLINERQKALEEERQKKQSNEELIANIKELSRKKNEIYPEKSKCIEVLEDMQ